MTEDIQPAPSMDEQGLKCFQETTHRSKCYLEYGSGGSTVYAAKIAKIPNVISVESDKSWSEKVKASAYSPPGRLHIEHCDIGEVGEWGTPKNRDKIENFWRYVVSPWHSAKYNHLVPDTILVDGRFRVAAFLFTLVAARAGSVILFDDYFDRPHYFIVEQFCPVEEKHGRMAVFLATKHFSFADICERIAQYSIVWS